MARAEPLGKLVAVSRDRFLAGEEEWGAKMALGTSPPYPVLAASVAECVHARRPACVLTSSPPFSSQLQAATVLSSATRAHLHTSLLRSYSGITKLKCVPVFVHVCVCVPLYFAISINCFSLT